MKSSAAALLMAMAVLSGCSTPFKDAGRLPEVAIAAAPPGAAGKSFVYEQVANRRNDLDVAVLHGLACWIVRRPQRDLFERARLRALRTSLAVRAGAVAQAGYGEVRTAPEPVGLAPLQQAVAYRITGTVIHMNMRLCLHGTGRGNYADGKDRRPSPWNGGSSHLAAMRGSSRQASRAFEVLITNACAMCRVWQLPSTARVRGLSQIPASAPSSRPPWDDVPASGLLRPLVVPKRGCAAELRLRQQAQHDRLLANISITSGSGRRPAIARKPGSVLQWDATRCCACRPARQIVTGYGGAPLYVATPAHDKRETCFIEWTIVKASRRSTAAR